MPVRRQPGAEVECRRDVAAAVKWMEQHLNEIEASCIFVAEESPVPDLKRILEQIARRPGGGRA